MAPGAVAPGVLGRSHGQHSCRGRMPACSKPAHRGWPAPATPRRPGLTPPRQAHGRPRPHAPKTTAYVAASATPPSALPRVTGRRFAARNFPALTGAPTAGGFQGGGALLGLGRGGGHSPQSGAGVGGVRAWLARSRRRPSCPPAGLLRGATNPKRIKQAPISG